MILGMLSYLMRKKILFVMMSLYNGGAEKSLVNLLNELPTDKYNIDLLLFKREGLYLSQIPSNITILDDFSLFKLYSGRSFIRYIGTFISRILNGIDDKARAYRWKHFYSKRIKTLNKEYDVAIAYLSGEVMYFVDEKVKAKKKIAWVHNDYKQNKLAKEYDYPHFKNMDAIVTISDKCADILKEVFPEFKNKIYNIPNITSSIVIKNRAEEFYPEEYRGLDNKFKILSIGRLNSQKGFDMAISAAAILKSRGLKFKWFVIGNGELEGKLNEQIKREGVEDCFKLIGVRENPYPYIKNCDIVVQPSRYEGKSVVLDEAKILAKPIVATVYPTVKDQIIDGSEGVICEMSPQGIADGINKLLKDEQLLQGIEVYLSQHEYGNQQEVQKYMDLIDAC